MSTIPVIAETGIPSSNLYLSDNQVSARYGVNRVTIWRWVSNDPTFPKPIKLSDRCTRWRLSDIEAWEAGKAGAQ